MSDVVAGIYEHYKGNKYRVIGVARHSETEESLVVYRPMYGDGGLWVRPKTMFTESVVTDEGEKPRFKLIDSSQGIES